MVNKPDFLNGSGQDQFRPELQLESPQGELHLRFYLPSRQEFALQAMGIREVIELSPDRITPIPNTSPPAFTTLDPIFAKAPPILPMKSPEEIEDLLKETK